MAARTNKTDAVIRLLTGKKKPASNPILDNDFKVEKITSRKPERNRAMGAEIDVAWELISELLPKVLGRFRCCKCAVCYAEAMTEAMEKAPTVKVRINNKEDMKRADKMKQQSRREVLMILIRLALARKKLPKHDG
ncbi:MAG: hypothetical protein J1E40_02340 [Oscillospiraceae bacterium]|nr:hypothetical protein [Oscillospiraceae bacterium]